MTGRVWTLDELIGELRRYDPGAVVTFDIRGEWGPPAAGRFRLAHQIPPDVDADLSTDNQQRGKLVRAAIDAGISSDDEHERAKRVGSPGGEIEPAVLCWAAERVQDMTKVCTLPLDEIDLVCPVHGKRRPPPDPKPARRDGWCERCGAQLVEVDNPMRREFRHRRGTECAPVELKGPPAGRDRFA